MLFKGQNLKVRISSLVPGGEGISKDYGKPIFINRVAPGDEVQIELFDVRKDFAKGRVLTVITPSEERATPPCKLFKACGGCQWQHLTYSAQVKAKENIVRQAVAHIGGIDPALIKPVIQAEQILHYRNKAQFPVRHPKGSNRILAGYFQQDSHELVNIKHCPVQPELMDLILQTVKSACEHNQITAYDEANHRGLLRHINIRLAPSTGEALVVLVINKNGWTQSKEDSKHGSHPTSTAYQQTLRTKLGLIAKEIMADIPEVKGVLVNFNPHKSNRILGETTECLAGKSFIEEVLKTTRCDLPSELRAGIHFRLSASSFFQVHSDQTVKLLEVIFDSAIPNRKEICGKEKLFIVDAYAGVGAIALWLSPLAQKVVAIEESPTAVADGTFNVESNSALRNNVEFRLGQVESLLSAMVSSNERPDLLVLDPPRKGANPEALSAVLKLAPAKIIYVSCNPATLARDLKILENRGLAETNQNQEECYRYGYKTIQIQPVDLFPQTYHIESVVVLEKK